MRMNVQIFGKTKCFDTKKAERYFKERNIKVQFVDILSKGLSKGEFQSVAKALGGYQALVDTTAKDYCMLQYLSEEDQIEKLLEIPKFYKTPIVRNGSKATIGYCPEIWKAWE